MSDAIAWGMSIQFDVRLSSNASVTARRARMKKDAALPNGRPFPETLMNRLMPVGNTASGDTYFLSSEIVGDGTAKDSRLEPGRIGSKGQNVGLIGNAGETGHM